MNFCLVVFILLILIVLLLRLIPLNLSPTAIWIIFVIVLLLLVIILLIILLPAICSEVFSKWKKGDESNPIMNLHDIIRNFIIISATLMWPLLLLYFYKNGIESVTFYGIEDVSFQLS